MSTTTTSVRALVRVVALTALAAAGAPANAATIDVIPSTDTIGVGSEFSIDLVVSGLGSGSAPTLGGWFASLSYAADLLSVTGVTYGTFLGDPDPLAFESDPVTTLGTGTASFDQLSFLTDVELDTLQPDSFALVTVTFFALAVGDASISIDDADLSDALGDILFADTLGSASVAVVPLPPAALLLLSGLAALLRVRRRF